ncbi:MAG: HDOD domain-containing protein [Deltaproteobacteria bacterium]|nr:HDOD domain-containing protein [Deltaproteobacteria bacterium]
MIIECSNCHKKYNIPEKRLSTAGPEFSFPCPSCKELIVVKSVVPDLAGASAGNKTQPPADLPDGAELKQKIMGSVKDLPPMPKVAQKARRIISDPESNFSDLAKVIETDQAIVALVLKMANSAYYGAVGRISSVQQASITLGAKTLQELLTVACASTLLDNQLTGYGLDSGALWEHSLTVASGARLIAAKTNPGLADDAFAAGLIHDAGKLILDRYIFERQAAYLQALDAGADRLNAERNTLGFDHAEIGFTVCQMWRIPQKLANAIRYHHSPLQSPERELAVIVYVADQLVTLVEADIGDVFVSFEPGVRESVGLQENDLREIAQAAVEYASKITT